MSQMLRPLFATLTVAAFVVAVFVPMPSLAESAAELDRGSTRALATLESQSSDAKALAAKAKGILVFPKIIKGGFLIGAQSGNGALRVNGKTAGYYNTSALSYGLQAGVQWFGYAMYFMSDSSLKYLDESDGWEIGSGPSVVVWDEGLAGSATSTSLQNDIYVFFFEQKGLMAGLGIQGTKITKITPDQ